MGIIKIFNPKDINEMISLYSSGECCSKIKLGEMFGVSKRVINRIFEENNLDTIRTGTRNKIIDITNGNKFTPTDEYTFIARHKTTGREFNDYNNVSGTLISYIKEVTPEIEIPTKFIRNSYYKQTGNYWYEQYFDIVRIDIITKKKKGELYNDDINEIVKLYQTKEIPSTHKLGKMFNVGHRKIAQILNDNDVIINNKGGLQVYPELFPEKYIKEDEYIYKAIHKETGLIFDDYKNISGALTRYLNDNYPEINTPDLASEKKKCLLYTGNYWYEEYFNIIKFKKSDLKIKSCPYCGVDLDVSISSIKYKNHLIKEHSIDIKTHVIVYPDDLKIFAGDIDKLNKINNVNNWTTCAICGKKCGMVNAAHLSKHNTTVFAYKLKYGQNMSHNYLTDLTNRMILNNISGKMISYVSKPEKEVGCYLSSIGIKFETNRQLLIGREIDILCRDKKIGIEFNGCKWHTEWFGKKDKFYHLSKTIACNNKGYSLIHIFEDEWVFNQKLIENKLKYLFSKTDDLPKIGARKTSIIKIDKDVEKDFLDKYHIQGGGQSTIAYGAYYKNELVGVMTFKKLLNNSNDYDLTRFASNYNYTYQGLGSKMLAHFINECNPDSIISFADKRWTLNKNNNLYTKLGFTLVYETEPDYKYYNEKVDKYKRFHKFGFRKQTLHKKYGLDLSMTETEMVQALGYDRIWDCGLLKYRLEIKKEND